MIYSANYGLKEPQKNVDLADVNDINYNTEAIDGLIHNTQVSLAPAYDHTLTYEVGDLVMYETLLYECITAITTPEAWDSTKWKRAYLSENAGGGGNANVTEISYSQYSALTPAEKANGTIYCVTNDPNDSASGGGGGGIDYSTTEQNTGLKWIDGKPIYQKTILYTNASVSLANLNIDEIVDIKGVSYLTDGTTLLLNTYYGEQYNMNMDITNDNLNITTTGWAFSKANVTIFYTKTTDTV